MTPVGLAGLLAMGAAFVAQPPPCPAPSAAPVVAPASHVPVAMLTLVRCVTGDLDAGRWRDAATRIDQALRAAIAVPEADRPGWYAQVARLDAARQADTAQWTTLATAVVAHGEALPWSGPLLRGVAAARLAWAQQDQALLQNARVELQHLERLASAAGPVSEEERARLIVQGAIAGVQYERDEMQLLLDAAHDLEVRLLAGDEGRLPIVLSWELQADLLRLTDRYAAASERYRAVLAERPARVPSRIGLAAAYRALGYTREAEETLAQARALWADADEEARRSISNSRRLRSTPQR